MSKHVVKKHLPQMKRVSCVFCHGTGKDPFDQLYTGSVCQVCNGRKEHHVHVPFQTCTYCKGSGVAFNSQNTCTICMGRGIISLKNQKEKESLCKTCSGTGKDIETGLPCSFCHGAGGISHVG